MLLLKRDTAAKMYVTAVSGGSGHFPMEAGVLNFTNDCRSDDSAKQQTRRLSFSKELISFSLYGKIPRKSKRPWNEALSSKIAEVQDSFKNIPSMLYFSPSSVNFNGIGVYAAEILPKGTMLGPYFGKAVRKEHMESETHEWLWEVYQDSSLAYFIDASDPKYGNWMNFIQCARNQHEQNLKALQYNGCLYFESVRDIPIGEELLVWYDDLQYDLYMGIPIGFRGKAGSSSSSSMTGSCTNSQPSSGNSEDMFLSSLQCPSSSGIQPTTGTRSRLLDTSSADSGINMSFEPNTGGNGGGGGEAISIPGPLESCNSSEYSSGFIVQSMTTSTQSELTNTSYSLGHQVVSMSRAVEPQAVQLPVFLTDNLQHKISELKAAAVVGPRFNIDQSIPSSTTVGTDLRENSVWTSISPSALNVAVTPGHPGISKYQHPPHAQHGSREALATWPVTKSPTTAGVGGKSRSTSSSLLYNMFSKTEDGTRWQCEECKRLFSSQGSLRAHARIHTGERPYQCQYCFRTFCQASTLRSHERLHTGEKPYKCEHCGRAFTQSAGLRSHLKTHRYDC